MLINYMKSAKQIKLAISEDSSDISESEVDDKRDSKITHQIGYKKGPNIKEKVNEQQQFDRQMEQQCSLDQNQIQKMIRVSEVLYHNTKQPSLYKPIKNELDKINVMNTVNKNIEPLLSASQTQTMQKLDDIKQPIKGNQMFNSTHFDEKKYQFNPQSKTQSMHRMLFNNFEKGEHKKQNKSRVVQQSLIATQQKIVIDDIPVYFPYAPYDLQIQYMSSVVKAISKGHNALLESPTGTGKTLCLLSSVLSWVDKYNSNHDQKVNVIYCSRTHTQLRQVQSQLQKTCFRPTMSNFGSRDQFCIKRQFSAIKGRDLMEACSKAVKLHLKQRTKRNLQFDNEQLADPDYQNSEKVSDNKQKSYKCQLYKSQGEYLNLLERRYTNKIITSQTIKLQGMAHDFCPYYYAFQIKERADLIFMPYNYILDVDRIPTYESIIKGSIIIFDQAHNVPEAACDGRSFEIYSNIFTNIETQMKKLQHSPYMSPQLKEVAYNYERTRRMLQKQVQFFKSRINNLADNVLKKNNGSGNYDELFDIEQVFKPNQLSKLIYEWFSPMPLPTAAQWNSSGSSLLKKQIHIKTVTNISRIVKQTNDLIEALKETYDGIFQNIEKLNGFISKCKDLIENQYDAVNATQWWTKQINHYRLSVKGNLKQGKFLYQVKLVCLTPSLTFNDILKVSPRSIILTSGTLSPLHSWEKQLKLKFEVKLVNKHVISPEQLHLGIVCKSLNNEDSFNFSYGELQKNPSVYKSLTKTLIHVCEKVRNGVLVIFPSYRVMKSFKDQLYRDAVTLAKLRTAKNICIEDKGTIEHLLANFKNKAKKAKGAVLFCVCRGKVSQGLDFSDELCRAVIFVGVPYPNIKDPLLNEKRQYYDKLYIQMKKMKILDENLPLTGDDWYTLNTMRAVNQGIGRVIRHINDYGMILMMDNRYEQNKLKNMLPAWAKVNIKAYHSFNELDIKLNSFFQQMLIKFPVKFQEADNESYDQFSEDYNPGRLSKNFYKKAQQKKSQKEEKQGTKKNYFDIMMNGRRKSKGKSKKKQIDFL